MIPENPFVNLPPETLPEPGELLELLQHCFPETVLRQTYGESSLFVNPGNRLKNGVYFLTVKQQDGPFDKASNLNRAGVYRVAFGLNVEDWQAHFGERPKRPAKGGVVHFANGFNPDFEACNLLHPHPVYAWMGWV